MANNRAVCLPTELVVFLTSYFYPCRLSELAMDTIDESDLDAPAEERNLFDHVTCNISSPVDEVTVDEVTVPGALALDIEHVEEEVERLDQLKASWMKGIALKRQAELEEIDLRD
ncbi:microtubule associated protein 65 [Striga asiatica]|uniref:Microtubule associated protein 65 n=1 Tax=Striga asiatica TaxID=4170 RepID=A0A5A7Q801_STRAF|nr:microtubule associated protein 65 [Striga asiatica]